MNYMVGLTRIGVNRVKVANLLTQHVMDQIQVK